MKRYLLTAAAVLLTACNTQAKPCKAIPECSHKLTAKAHLFNYNPTSQYRIDMTVSEINQTYYINDDNVQSWYYTVYASDKDNNLYCVADDLETCNIAGNEHLLYIGSRVMLIYDKDKPDYTGYLLPLNDWNN